MGPDSHMKHISCHLHYFIDLINYQIALVQVFWVFLKFGYFFKLSGITALNKFYQSHNWSKSAFFLSRLVCRVEHEATGRVLECHSNQLGVQFYTGDIHHKRLLEI